MAWKLVAFSGPVGSGKSTIALRVSQILGWTLASFGSYVRHVATIQGFDESRIGLQQTGEYLINKGWVQFCRGVVKESGWKPGSNLIVEGIRHIEALSTLEFFLNPPEIYLIYVSLSDAERTKRLLERKTEGTLDLSRIDHHPTELQVNTILLNRADLVVNNILSKQKVTTEVVNWIQHL